MTAPIPAPENRAAILASRFINQTKRHVFLTGKAGTGKTTFLRHIIRHTHKKAVISAPTGIAAINAGGVTLHSLFQLPFGAFVPAPSLFGAPVQASINTPASLIKNLHIRGNKRRLLQELELLIIDEVSMLRADLLDAVDTVMRTIRRKSTPFGGVQVLFIGDLLQLPPVVKEPEWQVLKDYYKSPYFFDAQCLSEHKPLYIELDKIYRQSDDAFIDILNNLRHNILTEEDAEILNRHYKPGFRPGEDENYIYLTTHNNKADRVNKEALQKLPSKSYRFTAKVEGDFSEYAYPVEPVLELKEGAQVMFIKNDSTGERRFFNGRIGKVSSLDEDEIYVAFEDEYEPVKVEQYVWNNIRYTLNQTTNEVEEEVIGTFTHYPLKLAWAITIHKSQGLTFEKAILDIGDVFAPGQAYVALSRLTSLDGLVLTAPIRYRLPEQHQAISDFAESHLGHELEDVLHQEAQEFLKTYLRDCFDWKDTYHQLKKHEASYTKEEGRSAKQKHAPWATGMSAAFANEKEVADKFLVQLGRLLQTAPFDLNQLQERIKAATAYFLPRLKHLSRKTITHIGIVAEEKKTKQYLAELYEVESLFFKLQQDINKAELLLRSAIEDTECTKEDLPDTAERKQELEGSKPERKRRRSGEEKEKGEGKKEKGSSREETLLLFRSGKTVEEIAQERAMAISTIEGHLSYYVNRGELPITDMVPPEKYAAIVKAIEFLGAERLTPLKEYLGDAYSYGEIRLVLAHQQRMAEAVDGKD